MLEPILLIGPKDAHVFCNPVTSTIHVPLRGVAAIGGGLGAAKRVEMEDEPSMTMLSRREMLLTPVLLTATRPVSAVPGKRKMTLAMHQNTAAGAGYRKSLEGWSRAGIKYVEITNTLLDEFLKTDDLPAPPPCAHRPGTDSRSR